MATQVFQPGASQVIQVGGIPSAESFGTPTVIVGPTPQVVRPAGIPSAEAFGTPTVVAVGSGGAVASGTQVIPRIESDTRKLNAAEEGLRAVVASCALEIATTDWGLTGLDASAFALTVWLLLGWLISQRPTS
jgi:hypothetical protein